MIPQDVWPKQAFGCIADVDEEAFAIRREHDWTLAHSLEYSTNRWNRFYSFSLAITPARDTTATPDIAGRGGGRC